MYSHPNPPLKYSFAGNELYVRARYMQWFPNDKGGGPARPVPTDIVVESWMGFFGSADTVRIRYKLTNEGRASHSIASQEFPFAYLRMPFDRYVTYAAGDPWTNGAATLTTMPPKGTGSRLGASTEHWAGFINSADEGLLLWAPQAYGEFSYSFFHNSGPPENSTYYLLPRTIFAIPPGFSNETQVFLLLGRWQDSRTRIYALNQSLGFPDIMPCFGTLDAPAPGDTLSGMATLAGWAIDDRGVASVEFQLDGVRLGEAHYGTPREDVAREYPGLPNSPLFGFSFPVDTRAYTNGLHTLEALASDLSGNRSQLRPGKITIDIEN
jgi:hypothetical protein